MFNNPSSPKSETSSETAVPEPVKQTQRSGLRTNPRNNRNPRRNTTPRTPIVVPDPVVEKVESPVVETENVRKPENTTRSGIRRSRRGNRRKRSDTNPSETTTRVIKTQKSAGDEPTATRTRNNEVAKEQLTDN